MDYLDNIDYEFLLDFMIENMMVLVLIMKT